MKLRKVEPGTIKVPEVRVTARFTDEVWAEFQHSVKEAGIIAPIICCEVEGEIVLVDGLHRLMEALSNKLPRIDVAVMPGDMVDVLTKNLYLDHTRGVTPVSEMVVVCEALKKEYQLDETTIAQKTGLTPAYVEKLLQLANLTPLVMKGLDEGRIGVGHAHALSKIPDQAVMEAVYNQLINYHWTIKDLQQYIDEVLAIKKAQTEAPAEKREAIIYMPECAFCHEKKQVSDIAYLPICRSCGGILSLSISQAVAENRTTAPVSPKEGA